MITPGGPGSLYIPESDAQPYAPGGSTYDSDPADDFQRSDGNNNTFEGDGGVPFPSDPNSGSDGRFFGDDLGPSTQLNIPQDELDASRSQTVARVSMETDVTMPVEYGFDTAQYRWLRGVLQYDETMGWYVQYSLAANDRFGGTILLDVTKPQLNNLRPGDPVDIHGHVDGHSTTRGQQPRYHVTDIQLMSTHIAM